MELHFDQELSELKDTLLRLASLAEQSVAEALKALLEANTTLARQIINQDSALDRIEVDLDARCIELIALRQPKAKDLRFLTMTMKLATELERVGDQAVSIANRIIELNREPVTNPIAEIPKMAKLAQGMVRDALDAFIYVKPDVAQQIIRRDDEVNELNRRVQNELTDMMGRGANIRASLCLMNIARKFERIADHACNIAEDVIYLYEGRDVRHQQEQPPAKS